MKQIKFLAMLAVLGTLCFGFFACGSDDDDEPDPSKVAANAVFTNNLGEQVVASKIGNYMTITYNSYGLPIKVYDYSFDYDAGIFWYTGSGIYESKFTMNKYGGITSIEEETTFNDGDISNYKGTFSYNGSGQLTGFVEQWEETEYDSYYNMDITYTENMNTSLTWSNGNLTQIQTTYRWKEGNLDSGGSTRTTRIQYSESNDLGQYTTGISDFLYTCYECDEFWLVGLFGKATADLPYSVVRNVTYDDGDSYSSTSEFTYEYNSDGTIQTEKEAYTYVNSDGSRSSYNYSTSYTYKDFTSSRSEVAEKWSSYDYDESMTPPLSREYRTMMRETRHKASPVKKAR